MPASVEQLISECSPLLEKDSVVYQELLTYFNGDAKIAPDLHDLREFLVPHRLYKVVKIVETSFMKCAYALVDNYPECTRALGMLRYYRSPNAMIWQDVEKAENIISNSLTMDVYGWKPDSFTAFEKVGGDQFELTAILAF